MRLFRAMVALVVASALAASVGGSHGPAEAAPVGSPTSEIGFVDPGTGEWHLRGPDGWVTSFYFGDPGDVPFVGDWDCDGVDTPGLYRQADGFVYLRNSNSQGIADIRFFFGNPGDVPLAGDFDGDGCDSVSIHRPSEGRIFIINELGSDDDGLGAAELDYFFGDPGDQAFVGDFDGDGVDTIGLHRAATGFVYYRNDHSQGVADAAFYFGDPGDRFVAGDWTGNGSDTPGLFRPSARSVFLRFTNSQGAADRTLAMGGPTWRPVAGHFDLPATKLGDRTWSREVVDGRGDPGRFNDVEIGNDGLTLVSYGFPLSTSWHELRVAHCLDRGCSDAEVNAVYGAMFEATSIAVPPTGPPSIAFHNPTTQGVTVARCLDAPCAASTVDPPTEVFADPPGKYIEAAFASDSTLVMSTDSNGHAVVLMGSAWPWDEVSLGGQHSHSRPASSVGPGRNPRVAFSPNPEWSGEESDPLEFVTRIGSCADPSCTFGLIELRTVHEILAPSNGQGVSTIGYAHLSVAEGPTGRPSVAVAWTSGPGLDLVSCLDPLCDTVKSTRIDVTAGSGRFVDLATTADGLPIMAYVAADGSVRLASCHDATCTSFEVVTLAEPKGRGAEVSMTVDWTGTPVVAYYDPTNGALVVARLN